MSTPYEKRKQYIGGLLELTKSKKGWAFLISLIINAAWVVQFALGYELPYEPFGIASAGAFVLIGGQAWTDASEASNSQKELLTSIVSKGSKTIEDVRKDYEG